MRLTCPRLLMALLLGAAGLSAFAQAPEAAASAPVVAASAAVPAPAPKPLHLAKPAVPPLAAPPATWAGLTLKQREMLAPLERDWAGMSESQRSKWLSATPTLATLPAPELARVHERMRAWAQLSPAERTNARIGFQVAKQVDAEQRQAKWEAYQALSPEKRQALAAKAQARRQAQAQATAPGPVAKPMTAVPKSNIVPAAPKLVSPTPVTGSLVQAKPGATTVLITRTTRLPSHHSAGETKIVADPALVDPQTLLPRSLKAPLPASAPRP
ncbi:DUF3106 domain-containing protein [Roseateles sp. BYS78W]|uniref:DUF3106 domain-containing protein n=1 Tax=Pelomonas candidula TaxID=3299025 RepID=A0ABW7HB92_9BURK